MIIRHLTRKVTAKNAESTTLLVTIAGSGFHTKGEMMSEEGFSMTTPLDTSIATAFLGGQTQDALDNLSGLIAAKDAKIERQRKELERFNNLFVAQKVAYMQELSPDLIRNGGSK
jgi:hypothetical protein